LCEPTGSLLTPAQPQPYARIVRRPLAWRIAVALLLSACLAEPLAVVESLQLSLLPGGTTMPFREPITVEATPIGHLGLPVSRSVSWVSKSPDILEVVPISQDGRTARISATGAGTGQVEVISGTQTRVFDVTVLDTVYSVVVTPSTMDLVVGDTLSLTAIVAGPASAATTVTWIADNESAVEFLTSPDANSVLIQAVAAGPVTLTARATADTVKKASAALNAQQGTLVFLTPPSTVMKGAAMGPAVRVEVQDAMGNRSQRAANVVTLAPQPGSCNAPTGFTGPARTAVAGIATFEDLAFDRLSSGCRLTASANPQALPATSGPFDVTARGCNPIPYPGGISVSGFLEASDCAVVRAAGTFYVHNYSITAPDIQLWRVETTATDFAPRMEAYLWPPSALSRDTAAIGTTVVQYYLLAPTTYHFSITSSQAGRTGQYSISSAVRVPNQTDFGLIDGDACSALITRTAPGFNVRFSNSCRNIFVSRNGAEFPAVRFVFALAAGDSATVSMGQTAFVPSDPYIELFDVTVPGSRTLIAADDSGAGVPNARIGITRASTNRFIEVVAGVLTGSLTFGIEVR
jgi:hypothetical protein